MTQLKSNNTLSWIKIILIFMLIYVLIYIVAYYTPMLSDDFHYIGINTIQLHWSHYMNWSGRIVADTISSVILNINNHVAIALINSFVCVLLIYNIIAMPASVDKTFDVNKMVWLVVPIFLIYWCSNPALGQTVFWIVGSANYLWTTLIIIYFMRKLLLLWRDNHGAYTMRHCLFFGILGLIVGCTNENTCLAVLFFLLLFIIYCRYQEGSFNKLLLIAFICVGIGAAILILCPGNFIRETITRPEWTNVSLLTKASRLFTNIIPRKIIRYCFPMIILLIIMTRIVWIKIRGELQEKSYTKKNSWLLFQMFIWLFIVANVVMVASPEYPPRTLTGPFVFLLCALALLFSMMDDRLFKKSIIITSLVSSLWFIPSYYSVFVAYKHAMTQDSIRREMITEAINKKAEEVDIPNYYFRNVMRGRDKFAPWLNEYMAPYFGLKKITGYKVNFDYSVINDPCTFKVANADIHSQPIKCIYAYSDTFATETVFVIEFNRALTTLPEQQLFIAPQLIDEKVNRIKKKVPHEQVSINHRYFSAIMLPIKLSNIKGVNFGETTQALLYTAYK